MKTLKTQNVDPVTHCPVCEQPRPQPTNDGPADCKNPDCYISDVPPLQENLQTTDVWQVYEQARAWLVAHHNYMAYGVMNLQRPKMTRELPTAAVGGREDGSIEFLFNPDFFLKLSQGRTKSTIKERQSDGTLVDIEVEAPTDVAFVMAHEASHILNGHVGKMRQPAITNKVLYNICADIFVNSWLLASGYPISDMLRRMTWDAKDIDYDRDTILRFATAEDLYDAILPNAPVVQYLMIIAKDRLSGDLGEGTKGGAGQPGPEGKEPGNGSKDTNEPGTLDDHKSFGEIEEGAIDTIMRQIKISGAMEKELRAGKGVSSSLTREFELLEQPSDWEAYVRNFLSSVIREIDTWQRSHRLGDVINPGIFKQGRITHPTYNIAVYVDVSGSVGAEDLGRFRSLIAQKPPQINICAYTFDCLVHEWHDWLTTDPPGGGGTAFNEVVKHAENQPMWGDRPVRFDGHIVLTDGGDSEPSPVTPRKWLWISTQILHSKKSGNWIEMPPTREKRRRMISGRA